MRYIHSNCSFCGKPVVRRRQAESKNVRLHFCGLACKANHQRLAKPVTREWLYEQYVTLGRDTSQIGKEVGRDAKSVWNWLKDFGIPTRPRGSYWQRRLTGGRPKGFRHSQETRAKLSEIAKADGRVPFDPAVGPNGGRRGPDHPSWKGGITPERQAFYTTPEWKKARRSVYRRDGKTCQRCGKVKRRGDPFDIHHVVSFECVELRAVVSNLVLLCEGCHHWTHSKANTEGRFILPCP